MVTPEHADAYRLLLLDEPPRTVRQNYCRSVAESLNSVSSWLGVDSLFNGGDVSLAGHAVLTDPEVRSQRYRAFRATFGVIAVASQLASGSIVLLDASLCYSAAALIRQLIEAEYLLTRFDSDLSIATDWSEADSDTIRRSFSPGQMRQLGGFSNEEYWHRCRLGGHPTPEGMSLLEYGTVDPLRAESLMLAFAWADLAQHLRRIWRATEHLLMTHHARFAVVRVESIARVHDAELEWLNADPLASLTSRAG